MKKICVLGLGYIGLPTAAVLAYHRQHVTGVDINHDLLSKLQAGKNSIKEPELDDIINKVIDNECLQFSPIPVPADVFIIAVPTPLNEDKSCDLSYVLSAVESIMPYLIMGSIIIIESTVSPQTCDRIIKPMIEQTGFRVGKDVYLAHCPERVLPGNIMKEIIHNDRIIGGCTAECSAAAAEIYKTFVKGEILNTDAATAEMIKLTENTFRDVNIAFVNELVKICNYLEVNALEVIRFANKHPRVKLHQPGPGVGGHCLAVDPYFIIDKASHLSHLIKAARNINRNMPAYIVNQVINLMDGIEQPKIAVLGLTYKGNVADIRESPALEIINLLAKKSFLISIYDPRVEIDSVNNNIKDTVKDADMILILTDHNEFKTLDYKTTAGFMRTPIIFDTKNIVDIEEYNDANLKIYNLGNIFENLA